MGPNGGGRQLVKFYLKVTQKNTHFRRSEGLFSTLKWGGCAWVPDPFRAPFPLPLSGHEGLRHHRFAHSSGDAVAPGFEHPKTPHPWLGPSVWFVDAARTWS